MKIIPRNVTDVIDTGYWDFAMYTLEARAIPSVIDGLKPTQRKLIYAMLTEHHGKKVKVADLGGISRYGYHHGEVSAIETALKMALPWNNNAPIFDGHGNFGSRLVPSTASPRYIYASLSENFKRYFSDTEVAPKSPNPENPEPRYYLPLIPYMLVNGVAGVSVGFKAEVLPRSIKDVLEATKSYLKDGAKYIAANKPIKPTFPSFKGEVIAHSENQWKTRGIIEYVGKYTYEISELPIGYSRETYVTLLNEMCDKDLIKDYDDNCSKAGFGFSVKVSGSHKTVIDADPYKYFKLDKIHTEILTTLGIDGKLRIFNSVAELVAYFCDFRLIMFGEKIEYDKEKLHKKTVLLKDKENFIRCVINNEIDFRKTDKAKLLAFIREKITLEEHGEGFIRIPLYECTVDEITKLKADIALLKDELIELSAVTRQSLYDSRIAALKA